MRKFFLFLSIIVATFNFSCESVQDEMQQDIILKYPEKAKDMNIYEVNIRQYHLEGTINAFIPHMDRLKNGS